VSADSEKRSRRRRARVSGASCARTYVWSLAGVLSLGFLLLISMLLTAGLSAAGKYIAPYLPEAMLQAAGFFASFAVISLLFAMPTRRRDVWLGAILTAALFEVGKFLIGLYIGKQGLESTYGHLENGTGAGRANQIPVLPR
jgi:membrane protein